MANSKATAFAAAITAMALAAPAAQAGTVAFWFNGGGAHGSGLLTVVPNISPPDPNPLCGTAGNNPCRSDPAGAYMITGITGTISYAAGGVSNAVIGGLVPISPAPGRDPVFDPLVPTSLSFVDYDPGVADFSYNNLYFPHGSPIDCTPFPYTGTALDDYGLAFTVAGGYTVNLWGDGDMLGPGTTTYGIQLIQGTSALVNQFAGVRAAVPEPGSLALLATGLLGLLGWRRRAAAMSR